MEPFLALNLERSARFNMETVSVTAEIVIERRWTQVPKIQ